MNTPLSHVSRFLRDVGHPAAGLAIPLCFTVQPHSIKLDEAPRRLGTVFAVRTGNHHHISVGIVQPDFPVLRRGVDVRFEDDLCTQRASSGHDCVKIGNLEPKQDTVPRPRGVPVNEVGVILLVPRVELQKQPARARDPLIKVTMAVFGKSVGTKQLRIPATARPDIAHCDEGLSLDSQSLRRDAHASVLFGIIAEPVGVANPRLSHRIIRGLPIQARIQDGVSFAAWAEACVGKYTWGKGSGPFGAVLLPSGRAPIGPLRSSILLYYLQKRGGVTGGVILVACIVCLNGIAASRERHHCSCDPLLQMCSSNCGATLKLECHHLAIFR